MKKRKGRAARPGAGGTGRGSRPLRIVPNKNRRLQVAPTSRKLFGAEAKSEFLEWFAATCNISLSARKCGFHYRTVIRHWREEPGFAADCDAALAIGYRRLEALVLQAAEAALSPAGPAALDGDREAPAETFKMDPMLALQLIREHGRGLAGAAGGSGPGGKPGRAPIVASVSEVHDALVKRLHAFGIRVEAEERAARGEAAADAAEAAPPPPSPGNPGEEEAPPPRDARSPSPANAGEDEAPPPRDARSPSPANAGEDQAPPPRDARSPSPANAGEDQGDGG